MNSLTLAGKTTALIAIDLQKGIVARPAAPHTSADVIARTAALAAKLRAAGGTCVFVHVDIHNFVKVIADQPAMDPKAPPPPPSASELVPEAGFHPGDVLITKRFWDAFISTPLKEELLARQIDTVLLTGISTHIGVESTARTAAALGFHVVLIEDATSSSSAEAHAYAIKTIFPRLARVRTAADLQFT